MPLQMFSLNWTRKPFFKDMNLRKIEKRKSICEQGVCRGLGEATLGEVQGKVVTVTGKMKGRTREIKDEPQGRGR